MRCLFAHKWVTMWEKNRRSIACFRRCQRCGSLERAILEYSGIAGWEAIRERSYTKAQQIRVTRQPLHHLDRLAHSFGLRRTRIDDGSRIGRLASLIRYYRP
jgi:hypothetical protein